MSLSLSHFSSDGLAETTVTVEEENEEVHNRKFEQLEFPRSYLPSKMATGNIWYCLAVENDSSSKAFNLCHQF